MYLKTFVAMAVLGLAAACQSIPEDQTVAQYCSNPDNANKDVCKVMVEVDGQRTALSQTNMTLSQARAVADDALARANSARQAADAAQSTANQALQQATLNCSTKTVNRAQTGSCDNGMRLVSCTQTRYTTRSGGLAILRSVDDSECRFNGRVLEMQVRCCTSGPLPPAAPTEAAAPPADTQPTRPVTGTQS
jgi:hypothetical protein